jgi:hypothetical protein
MNMSYCRFQNTRGDFQECADVLEEMMDCDTGEPLTREELDAAKALLLRAVQLVGRFAAELDLEDAGAFDALEDNAPGLLDAANANAEALQQRADELQRAADLAADQEGEGEPEREPRLACLVHSSRPRATPVRSTGKQAARIDRSSQGRGSPAFLFIRSSAARARADR